MAYNTAAGPAERSDQEPTSTVSHKDVRAHGITIELEDEHGERHLIGAGCGEEGSFWARIKVRQDQAAMSSAGSPDDSRPGIGSKSLLDDDAVVSAAAIYADVFVQDIHVVLHPRQVSRLAAFINAAFEDSKEQLRRRDSIPVVHSQYGQQTIYQSMESLPASRSQSGDQPLNKSLTAEELRMVEALYTEYDEVKVPVEELPAPPQRASAEMSYFEDFDSDWEGSEAEPGQESTYYEMADSFKASRTGFGRVQSNPSSSARPSSSMTASARTGMAVSVCTKVHVSQATLCLCYTVPGLPDNANTVVKDYLSRRTTGIPEVLLIPHLLADACHIMGRSAATPGRGSRLGLAIGQGAVVDIQHCATIMPVLAWDPTMSATLPPQSLSARIEAVSAHGREKFAGHVCAVFMSASPTHPAFKLSYGAPKNDTLAPRTVDITSLPVLLDCDLAVIARIGQFVRASQASDKGGSPGVSAVHTGSGLEPQLGADRDFWRLMSDLDDNISTQPGKSRRTAVPVTLQAPLIRVVIHAPKASGVDDCMYVDVCDARGESQPMGDRPGVLDLQMQFSSLTGYMLSDGGSARPLLKINAVDDSLPVIDLSIKDHVAVDDDMISGGMEGLNQSMFANTPTPFLTSQHDDGGDEQELFLRHADDDEAVRFRKCATASSKTVLSCDFPHVEVNLQRSVVEASHAFLVRLSARATPQSSDGDHRGAARQAANTERKAGAVAVQIAISRGKISLLADSENAASVSAFEFDIGDADVLVVNHYLGRNEKFVCLQARDVSLHAIDSRRVRMPMLVREALGSDSAVNGTRRGEYMADITLHMHPQSGTGRGSFTICADVSKAQLMHEVGSEKITSCVPRLAGMLAIPLSHDGGGSGAVPSEGRLFVNLTDASMTFAPPFSPSRAVLTVAECNVATVVGSGSTTSRVRLMFHDAGLYIIQGTPDPPRPVDSLGMNTSDRERAYMEQQGYVRVVHGDLLGVTMLKDVDPEASPAFEVEAMNQRLLVVACADSFRALTELMDHYGDVDSDTGDVEVGEAEGGKRESALDELPRALDENVYQADQDAGMAPNLFASLDQDAFSPRLNTLRTYTPSPVLASHLASNAERIRALNAAAAQRQNERISLQVAQGRNDRMMAESIHESFLDAEDGSDEESPARVLGAGESIISDDEFGSDSGGSISSIQSDDDINFGDLDLDDLEDMVEKFGQGGPQESSGYQETREERDEEGSEEGERRWGESVTSANISLHEDLLPFFDEPTNLTQSQVIGGLAADPPSPRPHDPYYIDPTVPMDAPPAMFTDDDEDTHVGENVPDGTVRVLVDEEDEGHAWQVVNNFYAVPAEAKPGDPFKLKGSHSRVMERLVLRDISVSVCLFGGLDFPEAPADAKKDSEADTEQQESKSRIGRTVHFADPSVTISNVAVPKGRETSQRNAKELVQVNVRNIIADCSRFPQGEPHAWRAVVHVTDFEVLDRLEASQYNKFLSYWVRDSYPRQAGSAMFRAEVLSVRPKPDLADQELRVKATLLPIRLNVDQDTLDHLVRFASYTKLEASVGDTRRSDRRGRSPDTGKPFFQHVAVTPGEACVHYNAKRIDLTGLKNGNLVELMNLFSIEGSEVALPKVVITGVHGVGRLCNDVIGAWLPNIRKIQIPKLLSGVAPIRSLVNVGSGVADLVFLPLEEYQRDQRVMRGLKNGAHSFLRNVTLEGINLSTKLVMGAQTVFELVDDVFNPSQNPQHQSRGHVRARRLSERDQGNDDVRFEPSRYAQQPPGIGDGLRDAYDTLSRELNNAATTIIMVPLEEYQRTGAQGAVKKVVRAVPVAVLRPMIGASEAVSITLQGIRNAVDPEARRDMEERYKRSLQQ